MLEQLPPKFKAIFFLFKENQKLFGVNKYRATTWRTQYRAGWSQFFTTWTSLFFLGTSKHVSFATVFILFFRIPVFHARGRLPRKFWLKCSIEKRKQDPNVEFCHINRPQKIQLCSVIYLGAHIKKIDGRIDRSIFNKAAAVSYTHLTLPTIYSV